MGGFFVKKWKMGGVFRKKVENGFFVTKLTFPQRRVHCVQYQYFFILHFTYLGVRTHPTHPTAYGPGGDIPTSSPDRWSVSASALK